MGASDPRIRIEDLTMAYGDFVVQRDLDLDIQRRLDCTRFRFRVHPALVLFRQLRCCIARLSCSARSPVTVFVPQLFSPLTQRPSTTSLHRVITASRDRVASLWTRSKLGS